MEILKRMLVSILVITFAMSAAPYALADAGDAAKMNKQLMNKINRLENRIKQLEVRPTGVGMVAAPYTPAEGGVLRAAEDIQVSGYIETSYQLSPNIPSTGTTVGPNTNAAGVLALHGIDNIHNSFTVNALKLTLEKEAPETGGLGFRADLMFGEDAKFLNGATLGAAAAHDGDQNNVYIENAYGILRAPYGNGIDIYFGRFVTLIGVEVIESKDNWSASRGILFNFGMPFAHTGLRAAYEWNDKFSTTVGINNGTDQDVDNNLSKSVEAKADYQLTDKISISQAINWGNDTPDSGPGGAHSGPNLTLDTILGVEVTDKWGLMVESLFGSNGTGDWYGIGIWNRYQFNDWIALSNRFEFFNDTSNARLGAIGGAKAGDDGYDVWEITFGVDFSVYQNLMARLEYRLDSSPGKEVFDADNQEQNTFLAKLIYSF